MSVLTWGRNGIQLNENVLPFQLARRAFPSLEGCYPEEPKNCLRHATTPPARRPGRWRTAGDSGELHWTTGRTEPPGTWKRFASDSFVFRKGFIFQKETYVELYLDGGLPSRCLVRHPALPQMHWTVPWGRKANLRWSSQESRLSATAAKPRQNTQCRR